MTHGSGVVERGFGYVLWFLVLDLETDHLQELFLRLDHGVDEVAIVLPLDPDATWVLPVPRMGLLDFVEDAEAETDSGIGDIGAEGPPDAFCAFDPALAGAVGALRVDVYRVDAGP